MEEIKNCIKSLIRYSFFYIKYKYDVSDFILDIYIRYENERILFNSNLTEESLIIFNDDLKEVHPLVRHSNRRLYTLIRWQYFEFIILYNNYNSSTINLVARTRICRYYSIAESIYNIIRQIYQYDNDSYVSRTFISILLIEMIKTYSCV
jgi:hypothetical protein